MWRQWLDQGLKNLRSLVCCLIWGSGSLIVLHVHMEAPPQVTFEKIICYDSLLIYRYLFVKKKVFNYSELHFTEVTFYKIHTLEVSPFSTISLIVSDLSDSLFLSLNFLLPSQMLLLHSTPVHSCSYVCLVGFSCHKWHTLFLTLLNLKSWGLEVFTSATFGFKMPHKCYHKIWKNLLHVLLFTKECQNQWDILSNFCALNRKPELYLSFMIISIIWCFA